ncbi:MAG TPA: hypothetical protein VM690_05520, partial [Gaiellaceae bacterium]|nr:hypothetical protein [Gaiellaceae bacterium]
MGLFGRREPLHERLAREGGLDVQAEPEQIDPRPAWQETGVHGIARAREWDATVTVAAPDVEGDRATFVALPDGSLLVEDGPDTSFDYAGDRPETFGDSFDSSERQGPVPGDLSPFAAAVEQELPAPYR